LLSGLLEFPTFLVLIVFDFPISEINDLRTFDFWTCRFFCFRFSGFSDFKTLRLLNSVILGFSVFALSGLLDFLTFRLFHFRIFRLSSFFSFLKLLEFLDLVLVAFWLLDFSAY